MLPNIARIDDICLGSSTVVGARLGLATVVSDFRDCPLAHGVLCEVPKVGDCRRHSIPDIIEYTQPSGPNVQFSSDSTLVV